MPLPDLREIGEAAMAQPPEDWQAQLVALLDVNPRRLRAWLAGEEPVPDGVWRELYEMLRQRQVENARLSYAIMAALYPNEEGNR